ncbi:hypothetical protein F4827_005969 [Paraburkholderia bannensis]|uniref:Uncharacterized protein n=1 Tax=Paraburkholderia bannensis TaxID=765414 RepID=A0A7W9U316_9BURK|nr:MULTISPECIES: hypothetical protein [Paraburkholderia]MBB3261062.1 hypothetical protein [Paraburkholderia sp. WP4_3_2]MBB6106099.1 hypothetical protein [Paraburkholderia bannensis]
MRREPASGFWVGEVSPADLPANQEPFIGKSKLNPIRNSMRNSMRNGCGLSHALFSCDHIRRCTLPPRHPETSVIYLPTRRKLSIGFPMLAGAIDVHATFSQGSAPLADIEHRHGGRSGV